MDAKYTPASGHGQELAYLTIKGSSAAILPAAFRPRDRFAELLLYTAVVTASTAASDKVDVPKTFLPCKWSSSWCEY